MEYKWEKGMRILYHRGYGPAEIMTITRVTPAGFAVITFHEGYSETFNISGDKRGAGSWRHGWIEPATDENIKALADEKHALDIKKQIKNIDFLKLPVDIQEQIITIVEAHENLKLAASSDERAAGCVLSVAEVQSQQKEA